MDMAKLIVLHAPVKGSPPLEGFLAPQRTAFIARAFTKAGAPARCIKT
jgi:hypothetical protein